MENKKMSMIELLRVVFSIIVVIYHSQLVFGEILYSEYFCLMGRGGFSVEFFFILTGLFMARHVDKKEQKESLGKDSFHYLKKKYMSVFPYMLFCFAVNIIFNAIIEHPTVEGFITGIMNSLPNLFMLQMAGITAETTVVSYTWYLSAMMLAILVLYPLLRKNYDTFIYILAPIITLFIIGNIVRNSYTLTGIWYWTGMFYKGFLRALAEISLGCMCYEASKKISGMPKSKMRTLFLTLTETLAYAMVFTYICTTYKDTYHLYMLPVLALAVTLTFAGSGVITSFVNEKLTLKHFGKLSLSIYVCQSIAQKAVTQYMQKAALETKIIAHLLLTIVIAVLCMLLVDLAKKLCHSKPKQAA